MSTDRETTRIVRSWLEEGATALPDRVLDAVLDQVPATPQRSAWWPARRYADVNNTLKVALTAAAVVVVAVIGINLLPGVGGPGAVASPSAAAPSVSPAPTSQPSVAAPSAADGLPEGPFALATGDAGGGVSAVPMTVTIPAAGWFGTAGDGIVVKHENSDPPDGAGMIVFGEGDGWFVPGDPCRATSTMPDTAATTVDDLVAALASQADRDASAQADITVGGYSGKSITLHVPADAEFNQCDYRKFCTLAEPTISPTDPCVRYHQGPGQIDEMWVLDVDGQLVVLDWTYYDGTPPADVAELRAIAESTTFE